MKKQILLLFVIACLATACKKDKQVVLTLNELDSFTSQIVEKIETAQSPAAGVDAARTFFEEKEGDLRERMKELGTLRGYQVSSEVRQKMEQSLTSNVSKIYGLKIKMMSATFSDKNLDTKLNQLVDDYTALVKGETRSAAAADHTPSSSNIVEASGQQKEAPQAAPSAEDAGKLKEQLFQVLGDDSTWKSATMASLKADMTCDQVRAVFPNIEPCEAKQGFVFAEATATDHPILARYKFAFQDGKLYDATLIFKRKLDREQFKAVSLELFDKKWGGIKPEERNQDILTSIGPNFAKAQRTYMVSEWQISHDFPKE